MDKSRKPLLLDPKHQEPELLLLRHGGVRVMKQPGHLFDEDGDVFVREFHTFSTRQRLVTFSLGSFTRVSSKVAALSLRTTLVKVFKNVIQKRSQVCSVDFWFLNHVLVASSG